MTNCGERMRLWTLPCKKPVPPRQSIYTSRRTTHFPRSGLPCRPRCSNGSLVFDFDWHLSDVFEFSDQGLFDFFRAPFSACHPAYVGAGHTHPFGDAAVKSAEVLDHLVDS